MLQIIYSETPPYSRDKFTHGKNPSLVTFERMLFLKNKYIEYVYKHTNLKIPYVYFTL